MISITNLFSGDNELDELNQKINNLKSKINDYSPSTNQGIKFNDYQNKISDSLEKNIEDLSEKEGFTVNEDNKLTAKNKKIISNNDFSSQQSIINNLRDEYSKTLVEYEKLLAEISGDTTGYINRVNPNNPYLNKTIRFTTGHICYVTNQGIVKWIPSMDIWDSVNVPKNFISLNIPWKDSYNTPGTTIPTTPPLITGTNVQLNQSFGNEGANVFVNEFIKNPQSSYVGCYNNNKPATEIIFVPKMNQSGNANGYWCGASSVYLNDPQWGAYAAFNQTPNDFWHSQVSGQNNYDGSTGVYTGINGVTYNNGSSLVTAKGEFIQVNLPGVGSSNPTNIPLVKYDIQGRQGCCGDPSGRSPNSWVILGYKNGTWYLVDKRDNQALNFELRTYRITDPKPYQAYIFLTTNCGNPGDRTGNRYCVQIAQWNLYTTTDYTSPTSQPAMQSIGVMNFEQCKTKAAISSNKYFSLNNIDQNGNGTCMVSNSLANVQQFGQGFIYSGIPLWDIYTGTGITGKTATLSNTGSLQVLNSSGQAVYSSPATNANSTYIGCYGDTWDRAMQNTSNNQYLPFDDCKKLAKDKNFKYFATQDSRNGIGWCAASNDLNNSKKYGIASNCTIQQNNWMGGPWSNAIYSVNGEGSYFLILQDDGNMCIYRGSGPNDNQGNIWCSKTNGKQADPNPNMTAEKSQFGRNYMISGEQLLPNQFIASNNGSIYLIMQTDGNLVLYTNKKTSGCSSKDGNNLGKNNMNAVNQISGYGVPQNIGKLAFIDGNADLHEYPSNNQKFSTSYSTSYSNLDSYGNDIPGAAFGNSNLESCQSACNKNPDCAGFVLDVGGNYNKTCFPKTKQMYPYGGPTQVLNGVNLYVRDKIPSSPPIGVTQITNNIDTVKFSRYINGGPINKSYGLANLNSVQKQRLDQLQTKLNLLTNQLNEYTNKFGTGSQTAETQGEQNNVGIHNYMNDIKQTNIKSKKVAGETSGNIQNILEDSDIVVLQKNYDYLFWSILAAGTVLVTMNIAKKQ